MQAIVSPLPAICSLVCIATKAPDRVQDSLPLLQVSTWCRKVDQKVVADTYVEERSQRGHASFTRKNVPTHHCKAPGPEHARFLRVPLSGGMQGLVCGWDVGHN